MLFWYPTLALTLGFIARYKLKGKDISELAEKTMGNQPEEDMNTNKVNDKEPIMS